MTSLASGSGLSPFLRAFLALVLRVGLGLGLLNMGLFGYMIQKTGRIPRFAPGARMPPSWAPLMYHQSLPQLQIVLGVAILLGFLTIYASVLTALVQLIEPLLQLITLVGMGVPGNQAWATSYAMYSGSSSLLMAVAVAWLAADGLNPLSIDSLVFRAPGQPK